MISGVEVAGFRCFQALRVEGLRRVNLFVGANNSGKSALLEAIEAVVSHDSPFRLYRATHERGEFRRRRRRDDEDVVELDIRHWFYGHEVEDGSTFQIAAKGDQDFLVKWTVTGSTEGRGLLVERANPQGEIPRLPLTTDGYLGAGAPASFLRHGLRLRPPTSFVTTDRMFASELLPLWTSIVLTPNEERAVQALRLVEPGIDRVAISGAGADAVAQVLLRGLSAPVPLGSLGEGVSRILTFALYLASCQHGYLFVDELENGLYWSVLPKLWRFLLESAATLGVQVFATTHSKDCIEALAELHRADPKLAKDIAVYRLETGRAEPIRFDAERIADLVERALETR